MVEGDILRQRIIEEEILEAMISGEAIIMVMVEEGEGQIMDEIHIMIILREA